MNAETKILELKGLRHYFFHRKQAVKAVDEVSFWITEGETLGLVGESGCGKSTIARCITRIYKPTGGDIFLEGDRITDLDRKALRGCRKKMQMVFQDPYASLNSRMAVKNILMEPLIANRVGASPGERLEMAAQALSRVGLSADALQRYPHEFSGGQRQRIGIARALILRPKLVICDEAISALDVSIQAQVINMLIGFQQELGLTYLFIAHDLSVVRYVSHRIGVMYLGRLVELFDSEGIYRNPLHPYTQALLESIPVPDPLAAKKKNSARIEGEIPSPLNPPKGCHFHARCNRASPECAELVPEMKDVGGGHFVRCHLYT
jgi:oligopeptide transport system ATP-binding protein